MCIRDRNDATLQQDLNRVIKEKRADIDAILTREGIPLLPF